MKNVNSVRYSYFAHPIGCYYFSQTWVSGDSYPSLYCLAEVTTMSCFNTKALEQTFNLQAKESHISMEIHAVNSELKLD